MNYTSISQDYKTKRIFSACYASEPIVPKDFIIDSTNNKIWSIDIAESLTAGIPKFYGSWRPKDENGNLITAALLGVAFNVRNSIPTYIAISFDDNYIRVYDYLTQEYKSKVLSIGCCGLNCGSDGLFVAIPTTNIIKKYTWSTYNLTFSSDTTLSQLTWNTGHEDTGIYWVTGSYAGFNSKYVASVGTLMELFTVNTSGLNIKRNAVKYNEWEFIDLKGIEIFGDSLLSSTCSLVAVDDGKIYKKNIYLDDIVPFTTLFTGERRSVYWDGNMVDTWSAIVGSSIEYAQHNHIKQQLNPHYASTPPANPPWGGEIMRQMVSSPSLPVERTFWKESIIYTCGLMSFGNWILGAPGSYTRTINFGSECTLSATVTSVNIVGYNGLLKDYTSVFSQNLLKYLTDDESLPVGIHPYYGFLESEVPYSIFRYAPEDVSSFVLPVSSLWTDISLRESI
jgi:hypothetical protein